MHTSAKQCAQHVDVSNYIMQPVSRSFLDAALPCVVGCYVAFQPRLGGADSLAAASGMWYYVYELRPRVLPTNCWPKLPNTPHTVFMVSFPRLGSCPPDDQPACRRAAQTLLTVRLQDLKFKFALQYVLTVPGQRCGRAFWHSRLCLGMPPPSYCITHSCSRFTQPSLF